MRRLWVLGVFFCVGFAFAQEEAPVAPKPSVEHQFLKQFVGEWECDGELFMQPGQPPLKSKSSMTGHMIGDLWAVVVVKGDAFGHPYHGQGTFGFDSQKKRYLGTWIDSMSEFLWRYDGVVEGKTLVFNSEGPNPAEPGKMIKARDSWDFKTKDLVVLTGKMEGPDGEMMTIMKATCRRVK